MRDEKMENLHVTAFVMNSFFYTFQTYNHNPEHNLETQQSSTHTKHKTKSANEILTQLHLGRKKKYIPHIHISGVQHVRQHNYLIEKKKTASMFSFCSFFLLKKN